jgi:hypothetical protein
MNHIKRLWGHYLALLILIAALAFPIYWVYKFFQIKFGEEAALIALTLTIMIVTTFVVRGAVYAHRMVRELKRDIQKHINGMNQPSNLSVLLLLRIFKIDPSVIKHKKAVGENGQGGDEFPKFFDLSPNRHRGKPPRFPKEQIRRAVLKWERRDPSITALTLEQFLAQEFGSSPDGILLMATTTFYDWRRRILKEIEAGEQH